MNTKVFKYRLLFDSFGTCEFSTFEEFTWLNILTQNEELILYAQVGYETSRKTIEIRKIDLPKIDKIQSVTIPKNSQLMGIYKEARGSDIVPFLLVHYDKEELGKKDIFIECCGSGFSLQSEIINYLGTIQAFSESIAFHYFQVK